jgi:hypothetical protein
VLQENNKKMKKLAKEALESSRLAKILAWKQHFALESLSLANLSRGSRKCS